MNFRFSLPLSHFRSRQKNNLKCWEINKIFFFFSTELKIFLAKERCTSKGLFKYKDSQQHRELKVQHEPVRLNFTSSSLSASAGQTAGLRFACWFNWLQFKVCFFFLRGDVRSDFAFVKSCWCGDAKYFTLIREETWDFLLKAVKSCWYGT